MPSCTRCVSNPCRSVQIPVQVALTRTGGIRCTYFSCLVGVQADENIMWFVDAVDASGEFGHFKLKDNISSFQRFVQIFGSPPKAMCLFQLTHWEFVPHGPRAAHCLRASMRILENPTSPECRQQFKGLVSLHTIDKVYLHSEYDIVHTTDT